MSVRSVLPAAGVAALAWVFMGTVQAQGPTLAGATPSFKVGDSWRWVRVDRRTGVQEAETSRSLTTVGTDRIEGTENSGNVLISGDGANTMETPEWTRTGSPRFYDFPLALGKKWRFEFVQNGKTENYRTRWQYEAEVVAIEKVKVPAGEFDTFKVAYRGYWNSLTSGASGSAVVTNWYAPAARATVRTELEAGRNSSRTELVEYRLQP